MIYNAVKTLTLSQIDEITGGENNWENRKTKTGVFSNCLGELSNINYPSGIAEDEKIDRKYIEFLLFQNFSEYESIYETPQMFVFDFTRTWNRYFPPLKQTLIKNVEIDLMENKKIINETTNISSESSSSSSGDSKFTDTPNQYLEEVNELGEETLNGLTTMSKGSGTSNGTGSSEGERLFTETKSRNEFLKWLEIAEKNRNIIYDFIDKFNTLFAKTYSIKLVGGNARL